MIQKQTGQIKINETLAEATYMFPDRSPPPTNHWGPHGCCHQKMGPLHKIPTCTAVKPHSYKPTHRETVRQTVSSFPASSWAAAVPSSSSSHIILWHLARWGAESLRAKLYLLLDEFPAPKILHFLCAEMGISILTQSKNMINCSLPESRHECNKPDWRSFSFQAIQLCSRMCKYIF